MEQGTLRQALEYYQQQFQKKLDELRPMVMTIRQLENDLGIAADDSTIQTFHFLDTDAKAEHGASTNGKRSHIRPDEYFTKSHGEAARDYLSRIGHAVAMDELLDALRKGGCKVGGIDPKKTLYTALIRNNWQDFISVGNGFVGLRSFYVNAKAPKTKAKQPGKEKSAVQTKSAKASKPAKVARTTKAATKNTDKAEADKTVATGPPKPRAHKTSNQTEPSPVKIALHEILRDGELHSGASIFQAVTEKLGSLKPIVVYGALRNGKEFEQVGTDYRMVM